MIIINGIYSFLIYAIVTCIFSLSLSLSYLVVRAKVLSQELIQDNFTRVFNIRILKTFKGGLALNLTEAIRPYGSNLRTLFARAFTASYGSRCGVELVNDTVYLLSGRIRGGKLQVDMCSWYQPWSEVTPRKRAGIRRFYGENCDCQISPCYAERCEKLKGCARQSGVSIVDCEWDHSYCVKNAEGTACSWRETSEFKNCKSQVKP